MNVQPYLSLDGRCEEALELYREALDAEVTVLLRFKDNPEFHQQGRFPAGAAEKILHASFRVGETTVMASDGDCKGQPKFQGISLALAVPSDADAERRFAALAAGGTVQQPLIPTFFSTRFGCVTDRFGVTWMISAPPPA